MALVAAPTPPDALAAWKLEFEGDPARTLWGEYCRRPALDTFLEQRGRRGGGSCPSNGGDGQALQSETQAEDLSVVANAIVQYRSMQAAAQSAVQDGHSISFSAGA